MDWSLWYDYLIMPVCLPLLLPLITGGALLFFYRQDKFGLLSGLFVLKPVLAYPVWIVLFMLSDGEHSLPLATARIIPAVIFTGVLVYCFRGQFIAINVRAWILLLMDVLRWGNTYLLDINSEHSVSFVSSLFIPSVYAVIALGLVFIDQKNTSVAG